MVTVEPLFDRVLLLRESKEVMSKSGMLHLPERFVEVPQISTVVAVGPDCKEVEVGDVVLIGRYTGQDVIMDQGTDNERKYTCCREFEIHAKIEKD